MRELLIYGERTMKVKIPDDAKVTFGPWSPPAVYRKDRTYLQSSGHPQGTLRIYEGKSEKGVMIACFANVTGFRDLSLGYAEEVAKEEGATIWKDDEKGYMYEQKINRSKEWVGEEHQLESKASKKRKG